MERTVKSMAKELAGTFYEQNRTPGFRAAFPTVQDYLRGRWHQPDGTIKIYRPGYLHHVNLARKVLARMLSSKGVHEHMKEKIFDALIEDRNQTFKKGARDLAQARTDA